MGRDVVGIEGVKPDLVVALPAPLEELAAVVDGERLTGRDSEGEVLPGEFLHEGVHLDGLEPDGGEMPPEDRGDVAAAQADEADLFRVRPEEKAGEHHRRVFENGFVRLREVDAGLAQVALAAEDHAPLRPVLADRDVVVDGVALVEGLIVSGGLRRRMENKPETNDQDETDCGAALHGTPVSAIRDRDESRPSGLSPCKRCPEIFQEKAGREGDSGEGDADDRLSGTAADGLNSSNLVCRLTQQCDS